jgi:hypothetical protein
MMERVNLRYISVYVNITMYPLVQLLYANKIILKSGTFQPTYITNFFFFFFFFFSKTAEVYKTERKREEKLHTILLGRIQPQKASGQRNTPQKENSNRDKSKNQ